MTKDDHFSKRPSGKRPSGKRPFGGSGKSGGPKAGAGRPWAGKTREDAGADRPARRDGDKRFGAKPAHGGRPGNRRDGDTRPGRFGGSERPERYERADRPERLERPERPERPGRPQRESRGDRPLNRERTHRPDRQERSPRPERSFRRPAPASRHEAEPVSLSPAKTSSYEGERIAKVIARAGLCSRRDAEEWILAGRVSVNGKTLETPAMTITDKDEVLVDGAPLPQRERTRLWLFHKPRGYVTTTHDPEGRATVFDRLPDDLPRVIAVGRLDINTEGLLLLTNDGGLARILELPATGWLRRYRVRAFGRITQAELDTLSEGIAIDGIFYGAIEASLDKEQGDNIWLTIGLREGKNREVKRVLEHLGLQVNRLIRLSFGPFQLADLEEGEVREIRGRVLRDQLGARLAEEAGVDFDAPILHERDKPSEKDEGRSGPAKSGARADKRGERASGTWLSAREGQAAVAGRKTKGAGASAEGRRPPDNRAAGGYRDTPDTEGRRENRGPGRDGKREDRPQKISPRSRYRFTSDPKPKARPERKEFTPRPRRIWDDEGNLVEDKNQNARSPRDDGGKGGLGKGGRPPKRGDRR